MQNLIPKSVIEKAIEGGWNGGEFNFSADYKNDAMVALDPTFWQALGKVLGWGEKDNSRSKFWSSQQGGNVVTLLDEWENVAHTFYDLILTGGDTEKFWADLLN